MVDRINKIPFWKGLLLFVISLSLLFYTEYANSFSFDFGINLATIYSLLIGFSLYILIRRTLIFLFNLLVKILHFEHTFTIRF